jgi:hypothetical protein
MPSSGWTCLQYVAVYGCVRALMTAVAAVTVAVRDTSGPPTPGAGSRMHAAVAARIRSMRSAGVRDCASALGIRRCALTCGSAWHEPLVNYS